MTDTDTIGQASAKHQPRPAHSSSDVPVTCCDPQVPPAAESIVGRCEYYYRPLHDEYVKKTGVSTWEAVKAWATKWNPWDDAEVARRLLMNRDKLIQADSSDGDWSRHANFMVRHRGCTHVPPAYYVSYGYYYCSTYGTKLMPRLRPLGQKWLSDARKLLQRNMEKGLKDNMDGDIINVPCKTAPNRGMNNIPCAHLKLEIDEDKKITFKEFAFKTHAPAYLDAGLADLHMTDLRKIGMQPNIEEWGDIDTWEQAIDSGAEVVKRKIMTPGQTAKETLEAVADVVDDLVGNALRSLTKVFR
ncbi:MAG: hypothetical protein LBE81_08840 [Azonexus sp.]|jgi:hypothetical protein|uniref:hypothetical protein n=1 Tax=Azonexus sp. TaxID=1872668 RepID=UPI00282D75B1|nr:hypothetical protein [Azonexus sp.]MDR0776728.1 hypothetical protein [Azonexus sp.]